MSTRIIFSRIGKGVKRRGALDNAGEEKAMSKERDKKSNRGQTRPTVASELGIEVDYEDIDVSPIIEAIKRKAAGENQVDKDGACGDANASSPASQAGPLSQAPDISARRSRIKRVLLKLMAPFAPLIKLLVLPVYEEQRQLTLRLHETNLRLDALTARLDGEIEKASRHREYTKLLHHLTHNIVVEMSKLKIEEEMIKTRTRVIEKDFELLTLRERALENELRK